MKRVFVGSIATETNSFSPLRTDFQDFLDGFYANPGEHPDMPMLCSAIFPVARKFARNFDWELIEGTATWAEPSGIINRNTWMRLRDTLLSELRSSLPVDIVLLGLHGAMIAQGQHDCEGELLNSVREIAGPDAIVGATFDPHSHLTDLRVNMLDLLVAFKEFPHSDFVTAAENLAELAHHASLGIIKPELSVFDARMIDVLPTSHEPMRSYIDRVKSLEARSNILSISVIHGFMAGDVPDLGAKIVVTTNNAKVEGDHLARELGLELYSLRGGTRPKFLDPEQAVEEAKLASEWPVVVADIWDNPGGGVPGDSTILAQLAMQSGLEKVAVGAIWDPMAVRLCKAAGEGARIKLRFGAKTSASAGEPIDAEVVVTKVVQDTTQTFGESIVSLGEGAAIRIGNVHVILISKRSQTYSPDLFSNMGIDPKQQKILIVKSTNHFYHAFAPIASKILYASVDGLYPHDPRTANYGSLKRPVWPICADPHNMQDSNVS